MKFKEWYKASIFGYCTKDPYKPYFEGASKYAWDTCKEEIIKELVGIVPERNELTVEDIVKLIKEKV